MSLGNIVWGTLSTHACKTGDIQSLRTLLQLPEDQEEEKNGEERNRSSSVSSRLLNKPIDSAGFTLLHVASAAGQKSVIRLLLDEGSDPANQYALTQSFQSSTSRFSCGRRGRVILVNVFFRDKKGQTPYGVAPEKDTRNTFRKYMAEHPQKYDYTKAQVDQSLLWWLASSHSNNIFICLAKETTNKNDPNFHFKTNFDTY